MKPLYLEMQAFGPFADKQCVDLEKLSRGGIFLIKGDTGSGKTTIFDAITVALYGGGSGDGEKSRTGRNDFEEWRCNQADPRTATYVAFTFSVKGKQYRFERSLTPKRKNLTPGYMAGFYDESGVLIPFFENPKKEDLNSKAVELTGLTKEQFRQVVLLPQGQFERFLVASSGEKEQILQKIFDSVRWENYARHLFDSAKARRDALEDRQRYVRQSLAECGVSSLHDLSALISELEARREDGRKSHAAYDGEKKQTELNGDIRLYEQFRPLHELERASALLMAKSGTVEKTRLAYEAALKAEALRAPIGEFESRRDVFEKRRRTLDSLRTALPEKEAAFSAAQGAKQKHEEASPVAELQRRIGELQSREGAYSSFGLLRKKRDEALSEYNGAKVRWEKAVNALNTAAEECRKRYEAAEKAENEAAAYRKRYFAGICGSLAAELSDGEKCPVCGSLHHPEPAKRAPESVSREQWDRKEKASVEAKKALKSSEDGRSAAEEQKNGREKAVNEKHLALLQSEAALSNAGKNLIEGINDLAALTAAEDRCRAEIADYEEKGAGLARALAEAEKELNDRRSRTEAAKAEASAALEALNVADAALNGALRAGGYVDYRSVKAQLLSAEERSALHREIVSYDTSCRDNAESLALKRTELEGRREPDSGKFKTRQLEINAEARSFSKTDSALDEKIRAYSDRLKKLSEADRLYHSEIQQAESDLAFAKRLRGDSGVGLQRYVLAIMFSKVIAEANRMLRHVHNGRYTLLRSRDKGEGNKRGLELKVHDNRCPGDEKGRSVAMLSGGEKFLVSLALSIGMSTVAQKAGVQIETLFIDEGFGTLDDSSIGDAMTILEGVRRGSGTIGIISHIPLLESTIGTQLEVVKDEKGNRIREV